MSRIAERFDGEFADTLAKSPKKLAGPVPEEHLVCPIADEPTNSGTMPSWHRIILPFALRQFPLLTMPVLMFLSLYMDSVWGTACVESIFVDAA